MFSINVILSNFIQGQKIISHVMIKDIAVCSQYFDWEFTEEADGIMLNLNRTI